MLETVVSTVRRYGLIPRECHVLVGVSGGADSVALAHALHYLQSRHPFSLTIAHLHHGIRGAAADEDRDFVRLLAWKLGAPCIDDEADVPAQARRRRISLEMAGREARREFFLRAAAEAGADRLATAHTADDEVETFFLRLLRGAGAQGLGGLPPSATWRGLMFIRPLIAVTKIELQEFLRAHGLPWREDATNADPLILRNRVRHDLLPYLEREYQPGLRAIVRRTAGLLREEHVWLDQLAQEALARCQPAAAPERLRVPALLREAPAARRRVLLRWLAQAGYEVDRIDFAAIERVDRLAAGGRARARVPLSGGWSVVRARDELALHRGLDEVAPFTCVLRVPGEVVLPGPGLRVSAQPWQGVLRPPRHRPGQVPAEATIRADRVGRSGLTVRSWRPGDRMRPLGLGGSVKLQDVFVDQKIPREARLGIPVFACGEEIVWVPGYRVAAAWAVPSERAASVRLAVEECGGERVAGREEAGNGSRLV
jgi:tRNA(Ile)-lysidine synthase